MSDTYDKIVKTLDAELAKPKTCDRAPEGWQCSRAYGHEGPCAAEPLFGVCNPGNPNPYKDDNDV